MCRHIALVSFYNFLSICKNYVNYNASNKNNVKTFVCYNYCTYKKTYLAKCLSNFKNHLNNNTNIFEITTNYYYFNYTNI